MIITRPNIDLLEISDIDFEQGILKKPKYDKWHLIKIDFKHPNVENVDWVVNQNIKTNRYIVDKNIRFYNWYFKSRRKKYYVENIKDDENIFSFFKKNNKILLNFNKLDVITKEYMLIDRILIDVLSNVEIIEVSGDIFNDKLEIFKNWGGNVIVTK